MTRQEILKIKEYLSDLVRGQVYVSIVDGKLIVDIVLPCDFFRDTLDCAIIETIGGSSYAIAQISSHYLEAIRQKYFK